MNLVNEPVDLVVKDESDEEVLHLAGGDVQLLGDEGNLDPGVGLDKLDEHLGADILQQLLNVIPDEGVILDGLSVV